jgi:hypothetical protein
MDLVASNLAANSSRALDTQRGDQHAKTNASKFDQIKRKLAESHSDGAPSSSAEAPARSIAQSNQVQPNQIAPPDTLANSPQERVRHALAASHQNLVHLRQRVNASSNTAPLQGITKRLAGIEDEYRRLNSAVATMPRNATPQQWMVLQQRVYRMSESVGTLSNIVNQAMSSVKSILQTQL